MKKIIYLVMAVAILFASCKPEDEVYYKQPASSGGTILLNGGIGGASAKNSVYVDFSTNKQDSVERISWNLALYCGDIFGVKLNNTIGSRATEAVDGISLATVLSQEQHDDYLTVLNPAMGGGDFTTADQITADTDLSGTVIKKDKIYLYSSGDAGKEIYKVKVVEKNATTYTVSYALWSSTEVKTLDIPKNSEYNFIGVSFTTNKQVNIQPKKEEWDIVWGRNTYISAMSPGVPFVMADIVFLNTKAGVQAQEILVSEGGTYDAYNAEKAANAKLSSALDVIGSNWRNAGGPSAAPSVKTDRFYVIKDVQGNIYKLGFVSMNDGQDGGKRGYPEIKFVLIKQAE